MNKSRRILLCALFLASAVVLGRILSIRTPIITIGFTFVPIIFSAIILGPKYSTFVATVSDIIGALLFPTGSYFLGFTVTSFFTGLIYGLFLYRKEFKLDKNFIIRLIISTIIVTCLLNGCLNTVWIIMISKNASKIIIPARIAKQLIMIPIEIVTVLALCKVLEKRLGKIIND